MVSPTVLVAVGVAVAITVLLRALPFLLKTRGPAESPLLRDLAAGYPSG